MVSYSEGDTLEFIVSKQVLIPDNQDYYVLSGPDKRKFLLPVRDYIGYGISAGMKIACRIDKINCKGEIFIEPSSPWYHEGEYYYFRVKRTEMRTGYDGRNVRVAFVSDLAGNEVTVQFKGRTPNPGGRIKLLVERISKGKPVLRRETRKRNGSKMVTGVDYDFLIESVTKGVDNFDYFIARDPYGRRHLISRRYYESYGLKPGSRFKGRVVKFRSDGKIIIEPENPYYSIGEVFQMKVASKTFSDSTGSYTLDLTDEFGHSHCVETASDPGQEILKCRVVMIRKGKPLFEIV